MGRLAFACLLVCACNPAAKPAVTLPTTGYCGLPGSLVFGDGGAHSVVPGGASAPDLSWMTLPSGFCVHYFANVPNARQLRFAPGGELFVASPTSTTTGGGPDGKAAILALADDDHDGYADAPMTTFMTGLPSTQGLLFTPGWLYYQDGTRVRRLAYQSGQRQTASVGDMMVDVQVYVSALHWPKAIDAGDDGTVYVSNGSDQGEVCLAARPFVGGVLAIDGTSGGTPVAKGMRNPIALRCRRGSGQCFALEMTLDYSEADGGREKLLAIRPGVDAGFPCCATANLPFTGVVAQTGGGAPATTPDCSQVASELVSFHVGRSPIGLEFERGLWPAPWTNRVLVSTHGEFGSWKGAEVLAIAADGTGAPVRSSELAGGDASAIAQLVQGWDDGAHDHGRPDDLAVAEDGRLFVSNDVAGDIVWIAPVGLGAK